MQYQELEKEQLISIIWYLENYIKANGEMDYEFVKARIIEVFGNGQFV